VLEQLQASAAPVSPFMSIPEAAEYLRCRRQRVDDLLSMGRLSRVKEGSRTLVRRSEVEALLRTDGRRRVAHALPTPLRNGSTSGVAA
jgi:excisionase family DNA binding protein